VILIQAQAFSTIVSTQAQTSEDQPQESIEHFSKMRVSQLQAFLKDRGQRWDHAEKRELLLLPLPIPLRPLLKHDYRRACARRI
jgi:hypothetical protein